MLYDQYGYNIGHLMCYTDQYDIGHLMCYTDQYDIGHLMCYTDHLMCYSTI